MLVFFLFILGTAVGSFLNVLVDRSETNENPFKGRSRCDYCKHKLSWKDLIPLISFAQLRGKCRYCHKKLSAYYPVTELTTGITFALIGLNFQFSIFNFQSNFDFQLGYYLLLLSVLIVIFFADLKYGIIPLFVVAFGVLITILFLSLHSQFLLLNSILSGLGAALFIFLPFLFTKGRGMGFGDVVYAFLMGLVLGFPKILVGMYIAFISGAIISLILVSLKKKKLKGGTIPFGPFLILGTITGLFFGEYLMGLILPYLH